MKKKLVSLLLCAVMAASALTFTGCGNSNEDKNSSSTKTETDVSATSEAEKDVAQDLPDESGITSVVEFLATDEMKSVYEDLKASLNEQGLGFTMEGTENKLTYVYTYTQQDIDKQATADALAQAKDSTAEDLKTVYDSLKEAGIKDPIVEYRFQASDGDVIYDQSYPEQAQ